MSVQIPAGSAVITPNQMLAELHDVGRKVDHLASILDPALAELRKNVVEADKTLAVLDGRMRVLENWRWFVLGISAVLGTMAGYGASLLAVGS